MIELIETTTESKIRFIANHYCKRDQWRQAKEEVSELQVELMAAGNPFGEEDVVNLPENTWGECADAIIMIAQLAMQHGKEAVVKELIDYKVDRQIGRINADDGRIPGETC